MLSTSNVREIRAVEFRKLFGDEFLLSVDRAAEYLDVSVSTLNHWRSDGAGPLFVRLSGRGRGVIRYRMADLRAFTEKYIFSSTAEADLAMSRMGVGPIGDFGARHRFLAHTNYFLIDYLYADEETYISYFRDPFLKICSISPAKAVVLPWVRWEKRESLVDRFMEGYDFAVKASVRQSIDAKYRRGLARIPPDKWCLHPDLTLSAM